jgi:hypothetical protein
MIPSGIRKRFSCPSNVAAGVIENNATLVVGRFSPGWQYFVLQGARKSGRPNTKKAILASADKTCPEKDVTAQCHGLVPLREVCFSGVRSLDSQIIFFAYDTIDVSKLNRFSGHFFVYVKNETTTCPNPVN